MGIFATCLVDLIRPEVGFSTVSLIEQAKFSVDVPKSQTCCGQALFNSGDLKGTQKSAKHFLKTFESYDYVVTPSGSCAAMIIIHYAEIFANEPTLLERIHRLASHTYELTQFLVHVAGFRIETEYNSTCTYHDSCSGFRELGIHGEPRKLLTNVKGVTLTECVESSACCGFGGTFCVKYPQISARIAAEKSENVEQTQADTLLGGDLGCLMNIAGMLRRRGSKMKVLHIAEVLTGKGTNPGIGHAKKS